MRQTTVRQCVVLVGGLGTRLGTLTAQVPKPLLPCGDRPFLAWLLRELCRFGVEEVVLLAGHLADSVVDRVDDLKAMMPRALEILVSVEPERAGTGGALFYARDLLDDRFLLLNGDSLLDGAFSELLKHADKEDDDDWVGRVTLRQLTETSRYDAVDVEGDRIVAFAVKRNNQPGMVNGGVYLFDRKIVDFLRPVCSLEKDVLPEVARAGLLRACTCNGYFIDIGVPADYSRSQNEVPERLLRPSLMLDRDGVINIDHGWVGTRDRFEWVSGAKEAIALATLCGWHVFVVTNQSGVARGLYSEEALLELHRWMVDEIRQAGGTIDDIRYCPYHPNATVSRYRMVSELRKPRPGMILGLIRDWELEVDRCVLVGDRDTDIAAARAAGVVGMIYREGNLKDFLQTRIYDAKRASHADA